MSGLERSGGRRDDVVFVRRCRIIVAGLFRFGALVLAGVSVVPLLMGLSGGSFLASRGGSTGAVVIAVLIGIAPLISASGLWFGAAWLSRRVFPEVVSRNQCPKCRYPLEGLSGDTCPECGAKMK